MATLLLNRGAAVDFTARVRVPAASRSGAGRGHFSRGKMSTKKGLIYLFIFACICAGDSRFFVFFFFPFELQEVIRNPVSEKQECRNSHVHKSFAAV